MKIINLDIKPSLTGGEYIPIFDPNAPAGQRNKRIAATSAIGSAGSTGPQGLSAYDMWISAGYHGTITQFLATLKGPRGPNGLTGAAGLDAYHIWLANSHTGSVQDFLDWLIGPPGPAGASGGFAAPVKLDTHGATTLDPSAANVFIVNMTDDTSLNLPTTTPDGRRITIKVKTNGHALTLGDKFDVVTIDSDIITQNSYIEGSFNNITGKFTGIQTLPHVSSGDNGIYYSFTSATFTGDDNSDTTLNLVRSTEGGSLPAHSVDIVDGQSHLVGTASFAQGVTTAHVDHYFENTGDVTVQLSLGSFDEIHQPGNRPSATVEINSAPRSSQFLVIGNDYSVGLYDESTRNRLAIIDAPQSDLSVAPTVCKISPDGKLMAYSLGSYGLRVKSGKGFGDWSVDLSSDQGSVFAVFWITFSPDSTKLVAHGIDVDQNPVLKAWKYAGAGVWNPIGTGSWGGNDGITWKDNDNLLVSSYVVALGVDNKLQVINITDNTLSLAHEIGLEFNSSNSNGSIRNAAGDGYIFGGSFSSDGRLVYNEAYNSQGAGTPGDYYNANTFIVRTLIVDANSYQHQQVLLANQAPGIVADYVSAIWSPDAKLLAVPWRNMIDPGNSGWDNSGIKIYDTSSWTLVRDLPVTNEIGTSTAISNPLYSTWKADSSVFFRMASYDPSANSGTGGADDPTAYIRGYAADTNVDPKTVSVSYVGGLTPAPGAASGLITAFDLNANVAHS